MADVKICDRCGRRLDEDRASVRISAVNKPRFVMTVSLFKKENKHDIRRLYPITTTHDLCVDCTTDLAEFLENKPVYVKGEGVV